MREVSPSFFNKNAFPVCLAPMVGLSHAVLRLIVKDYMPAQSETIWPTEMLNSRRIPKEILGKTSETFVLPTEINLVPQLLGNQSQEITESIVKLNQHWNLSGIDINMGCPVQKALKHNYGVSLMGDMDYAALVVKYAVEAASTLEKNIPISVKLRAVGSDKSLDELCFFIDKLTDAGASWVTLHPRTAEQKRRGQSDWNQIKYLKSRSRIPIIGNGDIQTADDVFTMLTETQADKVMSGRALTVRPWLMWQVGERLGLKAPPGRENENAPQTPEEEGAEYGRMLLKFVTLADKYFIQELKQSENLILRKIQFFVKTNHVWMQFGNELTSVVNRAKTIPELKENVSRFFEREQAMCPRTELRQ
ncbi:MAG: tRNA-dihydrouridine synthase family protein [Bdellovibrionaceae bacterium]|nr:tRNA-dihydrouridine synthase family protein [Pseudobdellovibrionaceae bacterium]